MSAMADPAAATWCAMQPEHLQAVVEIEQDNMAFPWTPGNFRDSLQAGHQLSVLVANQQVLGFAVLMMVLDEAHLLNIGVAKAYQGQGLGKRLLHRVMQQARDLGGENLFLEVRLSNRIAIQLYLSMGMTEMGIRPGYYPAKQGREDALLMGCALV